jgi:hypothetical protein
MPHQGLALASWKFKEGAHQERTVGEHRRMEHLPTKQFVVADDLSRGHHGGSLNSTPRETLEDNRRNCLPVEPEGGKVIRIRLSGALHEK